MQTELKVPLALRDDLSEAITILKRFGSTEIYLFGSIALGNSDQESDIDIATVGLPKDRFFAAYGELLMKLDHPFDLIGLDYDNEFTRRLRSKGALRRVA